MIKIILLILLNLNDLIYFRNIVTCIFKNNVHV